MIVLILGPSGVGKTTVIEELVVKHNWIPIESLITRPSRHRDSYKTSISEAEYQALQASKKLFSDVVQFGHSYGILHSEIETAIADSRPHILDFSLSRRLQVFGQVPHLAIALVPESEDELVRRLTEAGRCNRTHEAFADLASIQREALEVVSAAAPVIIVNKRDRVSETANHIDRVVSLRFPRTHGQQS